jgi:hypothetical protein
MIGTAPSMCSASSEAVPSPTVRRALGFSVPTPTVPLLLSVISGLPVA